MWNKLEKTSRISYLNVRMPNSILDEAQSTKCLERHRELEKGAGAFDLAQALSLEFAPFVTQFTTSHYILLYYVRSDYCTAE